MNGVCTILTLQTQIQKKGENSGKFFPLSRSSTQFEQLLYTLHTLFYCLPWLHILRMFSSAIVSTFSRTSRRSAALFSSRYLHATAASMAKLNVEGLAEKVDLKGQNVLMRVDLNVPLSKEVRMKTNITFIDELTINGVFVYIFMGVILIIF